MKHFVTWIACLCLGVPCLCQAQAVEAEGESTEPVVLRAVIPDEPTVSFVNHQTEEFTALVGQSIKRTGLIRFADAEIPPDPNQPVVRAPRGGSMSLNVAGSIISSDYSLSIQGEDSNQFMAMIVKTSLTSNECTVTITYRPRSEGVHRATVVATCLNAGVPTVTIPVVGETTGTLGDINSDGLVNIIDLTGMINWLLIGKNDNPASDVDDDGEFSIRDVTHQINRLLTNQ